MEGQLSLFTEEEEKETLTRFEFIKTLTPELFAEYMYSKASSVCRHNGNGERWKTHCRGKYRDDCKGCYREFWTEENVKETTK